MAIREATRTTPCEGARVRYDQDRPRTYEHCNRLTVVSPRNGPQGNYGALQAVGELGPQTLTRVIGNPLVKARPGSGISELCPITLTDREGEADDLAPKQSRNPFLQLREGFCLKPPPKQ
jgi:hypothetical protein